MPTDARVWKVTEGGLLQELRRGRLGLEERLEKWLEENISILSPGLLVIGRQVKTAHGGYVDLLCVGSEGDLTIVELKRDKTPREITAQALDYASWISDLGHEEVVDLANSYFARRQEKFEDAFRRKFAAEIPETLNQGHAVIIVGAEIDGSSERIVKYLSEHHGVNINAATFQFLVSEAGDEFLARVFLLEPEEVQVAASARSKRAPNLTPEQLASVASERGVANIYDRIVSGLSSHFLRHTTLSTLAFDGAYEGSRRAIMSLVPGESSTASGLAFLIYTERVAAVLKVAPAEVEAHLPAGSKPWRYYPDAPPDLCGRAGFFRTPEEVDRFVSFIASHLSTG